VRLLLDTHVLIALIEEQPGPIKGAMRDAMTAADSELHASVASFWEISIKVGLGKLAVSQAAELLPSFIERRYQSSSCIDDCRTGARDP
jgi:PIN domain nuclease of toxin-antitoxin system